MTWPVRWFLRQLDAGIQVTPGSAELLTFVRSLLT